MHNAHKCIASCAYFTSRGVRQEKKKIQYGKKKSNTRSPSPILTCWLFSSLIACCNVCKYCRRKKLAIRLATRWTPRKQKKHVRNYHDYGECGDRRNHRTDTPERLVNIRAVMFIDASSWKRSLAAYGICTCEIRCLLLHSRHSNSPFLSFLQLSVHCP